MRVVTKIHTSITITPVISRHPDQFLPGLRCRALNAGSFSPPFLLESTRQTAAVTMPPAAASCTLSCAVETVAASIVG